MYMSSRIALCLLIPLSGLALFFVSAAPQKERDAQASIIGKWRVTSDHPNDIKNHTYDFLKNSTCIEKYLSDQMAGSIDEPPQSVTMETVITYHYKALGGRRYRLYPVKSLCGGQPTNWVLGWHVFDVTMTKNKAVVYVAARQEMKIDKVMEEVLDAVEKNKKKVAKQEQQTWIRVP